MAADEAHWSVDEVLPILREVPLFEDLPEEDIRQLAEIAKGANAETGEILFEEGEAGDAFYIVADGAVEIVKSGPNGEEKLAVRRAGEAFGEMALIDDAPRSATARAAEPARLILVDRESFRVLFGDDRLAARMLEVLAKALRALNVRFTAQQRRADTGYDVREMSRLLQRGLLPRNAPRVEGYDIAAGTSLEESGEGRTVWDAVPLVDGRIVLVSLLVRGDGFLPAHHLAVARALLREIARHESRITEILQRTNEGIAGSAVEGVDPIVECGLLAPAEGAVIWSGAGRSPGAVLRRDGNYVELPSHGPPLGMMEGFRYASERVEMAPGDVALVLSEASRGLFRGAADLVATLDGKPVGEVVSMVHKALRKAGGGDVPETSVLFARRR